MSENETITAGLGNDGAGQDNPPANEQNLNNDGVQTPPANDDGAGQDNPPQNNDADGLKANEFQGAPEAYDFNDLQLPDGFQIDTALAEKFAPLGKELNLSQQGANKLANLLVEYQQSQMATANEKLAEYKKQEAQATKLSYEKLLNTDAEIGGGDKAKMNAYIDVADVGYNSFASSELKSVLQGLHLDYHPAVIKHFYRLGKLCGNDSITKTGSPTGAKQDAADILYGNKQEQVNS